MTALDDAHAAMAAAPEDDAARLAFFGAFAGTELFLLLDEEATGDDIRPALFSVEGARYLLAFDREERLAAFSGTVSPYAALPGRGLVQMIAGEGIGIALNAEAPSAFLIPPEAVDWLATTLDAAPEAASARPVAFHPPRGVPEGLLTALDARLAAAAGLAQAAWLAGVDYDGGGRGHILILTGALPGAETALATAVNEALTFSGVEAGWLDVAFLSDGDPALAADAAQGLRFDIPAPEAASTPVAPGSDPARPPKLR